MQAKFCKLPDPLLKPLFTVFLETSASRTISINRYTLWKFLFYFSDGSSASRERRASSWTEWEYIRTPAPTADQPRAPDGQLLNSEQIPFSSFWSPAHAQAVVNFLSRQEGTRATSSSARTPVQMTHVSGRHQRHANSGSGPGQFSEDISRGQLLDIIKDTLLFPNAVMRTDTHFYVFGVFEAPLGLSSSHEPRPCYVIRVVVEGSVLKTATPHPCLGLFVP